MIFKEEEFIQYLIERGHEWILEMRRIHRRDGRPFLPDEMEIFLPFFEEKILKNVVVTLVPKIDNPPFYNEPPARNIPGLLDISNSLAITFVDCIVIATRFHPSPIISSSLLFHELVHVVQYDIMGSRGFVEAYLRGWVENGLIYERIPAEMEAYKLQREFEMNPKSSFSVRDRLCLFSSPPHSSLF
jgi:hypothetical protein